MGWAQNIVNPGRDFEEQVDDAFTDLIRFFPTYARLNSLTERPGYDTQVETKPPPAHSLNQVQGVAGKMMMVRVVYMKRPTSTSVFRAI